MTDSPTQQNQGAGGATRFGNLRRYSPPPLLPSIRLRSLTSLLLCSFLLSPVPALAEYSYSVDGSEVTDSITGLTWRRCSEGMAWSGGTCTGTAATYTHEGALQRATSEATASKAWRLPNVLELSSITKAGEAVNPSIDTTAFPGTPSSYFWTSSPYVGYSGVAWSVVFGNGCVNGYNRYWLLPCALGAVGVVWCARQCLGGVAALALPVHTNTVAGRQLMHPQPRALGLLGAVAAANIKTIRPRLKCKCKCKWKGRWNKPFPNQSYHDPFAQSNRRIYGYQLPQ